MFQALIVYFVCDVILSVGVALAIRKRLPAVRAALRTFLAVPKPCEHACAEEDFHRRKALYDELMVFEESDQAERA